MRYLRFVFAFGLLILSANLVGAQEEQSQAIKTGTISGRVINEKGQPVSEAAVSIRAYGAIGPSRSTTTDREGNFQFSGLAPVVYLLNAGFPTYTTAPRDPDSTQATSYRVGDNVTLVLIKGGVITGKVTTNSGEPVVRVRVRAQLVRDANGQRSRYGATMQERITDDRGVYRFYGLPTGTYLVLAGGGDGYASTPFLNDAPTYAPSSTRDTAAEVAVQAGDETTNIDIRYRGDQGHTVSGIASGLQGPDFPSYSITLTSTLDAGSQLNENTYQAPGTGFSFNGVADGDYDVTAQSYLPNGDRSISPPKRIKVRGADVTGVELATKPLGTISGRIVLEDSNAPECTGKRRAAVTEALISAWHNEKEAAKDQPQFIWALGGPAYPNDKGEITLRNLAAGQYQIISRLFAKYWYLRSITLASAGNAGTGGQPNRSLDVVSNWTTVRPGDRLSGLTVTLSAGAGSLQGQIKLNEGETLPGRLYVYLVPVEREKEQDVLRFFAAPVSTERKIAINHIAPGRYWIVAQPALEGATPTLTRLRLPDEKEIRTKLRRDAEQTKIEIEFKPCQNVTDYELPLRPSNDSQRAAPKEKD